MTSERTFALGVFASLVGLVCVLMACVRLSDAQQAQIAKDQVELSLCVAEGTAAKEEDAGAARAWAVFDDCMVRHGFYDAGAHDAR